MFLNISDYVYHTDEGSSSMWSISEIKEMEDGTILIRGVDKHNNTTKWIDSCYLQKVCPTTGQDIPVRTDLSNGIECFEV